MSINKKFIITAAVAGLALSVSSCKKYLDVNTNPNVAHQATVITMLPAAQLYLGSAMGVDMQINGSVWSQFWTQTPAGSQYRALDQFDPKADYYNASWKNLYLSASNAYQLYNLADSQHKGAYKAISLLMRAYAFQALTDGWGDVPFKDALSGQFADGHITSPKYDSQRVVYRGILAYIDSASALINLNDGAAPGADDLIYGGNMSKWQKFANTLKLRVLMRMSGIEPLYANPRIDTMFLKGTQFMGAGDDAVIAYGSGATNNNPLYAELTSVQMGGVQQMAGSKTAIDEMNSNNDYRSKVFFTTVPGAGRVGIKQGEYDIMVSSSSYSVPSAHVGGNAASAASAKAGVVLLSSWESYFLQAEAVARGITAAGGDDADLFYKGLNASFSYWNNALVTEGYPSASAAYSVYVNGDATASIPAAYWGQYPVTGTADDKVRHIITQKWFSMCGTQGFEAWTEWRRTGYPTFLINPRNSRIGAVQLPSRFVYPASEAATNANYPGLQSLTTRVWWDKN
jgi:hypothetical protein